MKKSAYILATALFFFSVPAYASDSPSSLPARNPSVSSALQSPLQVSRDKWEYDEENDIYYQIGLVYCAKPQAYEYESLAVYVPGAYFDGRKNEDGTYTCTINKKRAVGKYTAATAPIVMPLNTGGYAAQEAPASYNAKDLSAYLDKGFVYIYAGCRGRDNGTNPDGTSFDGGAPWGVTDLKAAIRYLRYNTGSLPGDKDRIFTFGHSGGGAQSALMGATGDSELYAPYLDSIGAIMKDDDNQYISDAIYGAMCWCPITNLTQSDLSYEWMMGQYSHEGTRNYGTWTREFSRDMARAYPALLNQLQLRDETGNLLTLTQSTNGIYASGSYYGYMKKTIEDSLNHFLSDTAFPWTSGSDSFMLDGDLPGGKERVFKGPISPDGRPMQQTKQEPVTYDTAGDYISALNKNTSWIHYDEKTNTASISSIEAFITHMKSPSKDTGAFDDLNKKQAENRLFGTGKESPLHFDPYMAYLLKANQGKYSHYADWDEQKVNEYINEIDNTDNLSIPSPIRQMMYDPMTYLVYDKNVKQPSTLAKHWRIRSGIFQSDTSLNTELNLALALKARPDVDSVDFETVWEQKHTKAERTGNSTDNFIFWVESVCP